MATFDAHILQVLLVLTHSSKFRSNIPEFSQISLVEANLFLILRDDMDSVNLVAIHNPTTGQDSWNFFANIFSTHTPAGSTSVVATKFSEATNNIFQVIIGSF